MSYLSDIAFAFRKTDWDAKVFPILNAEAREELTKAESYDDGECIGFRLTNVVNWEETPLFFNLYPFVTDEDTAEDVDYYVSGERALEYGVEVRNYLGFIQPYGPYFRFENEVGLDEVDGICRRLIALLLSKGVTLEEIKAAAKPSDKPAYGLKSLEWQVEAYAKTIGTAIA